MTSTTPLSGTVVTTHTFDAANRLTNRAVSDGRAYTYTWSANGQMLAEYTQGVPVRMFEYDGAGQMVRATVFTLTTEFVYNGLGARVALSVTGATTRYTLDYAAGQRILAETTPTSTVTYLYPSASLGTGGHECLGEFRDDEPLYYLPDAEGYVRQGVDADGALVSAWLFDPDGTVLEGPSGPVSHLICGGVYDWSTGLIYRGGRYFDPALGIWLALLPLMVVQAWPGKKRRRSGQPWMMICFGLLVTGILSACGNPPEPPKPPLCTDTPSPLPTPTLLYAPEAPWEELADLEVTPLSPPLGNQAVMVGPGPNGETPSWTPDIQTWTQTNKQAADSTLNTIMNGKFGGSDGFGNLNAALVKFGVSEDRPIVLFQRPNYSPDVPLNTATIDGNAFINVFDSWFTQSDKEALLGHEMTHYWDITTHNDVLDQDMKNWINWGNTATKYGTHSDDEDLAEAVTVYFWNNYRGGEGTTREWTDDAWAGLALANQPQYGGRGKDGLVLAPNYTSFPLEDNQRLAKTGTQRVYDRYDWLECEFSNSDCKP